MIAPFFVAAIWIYLVVNIVDLRVRRNDNWSLGVGGTKYPHFIPGHLRFTKSEA